MTLTNDRPLALSSRAALVLLEHQRATPASRECICGQWQPFDRPFHEHLVDELRRAGVGFAPIPPIAARVTYSVHEIAPPNAPHPAYEVAVRRGQHVIDRRVVTGPLLVRRLRTRIRLVELQYGAVREVR